VIAPIPLGRVGVRHRTTAWTTPQQAAEQSPVLVADSPTSGVTITLQERLHPPKQLLGHERFVLTTMRLLLVLDLADVGDVGEQRIQAVLGEEPSAPLTSLLGRPAFRGPAAPIELGHRGEERLIFEVQVKDLPHPLRFDLVDDELRFFDRVSQERHAAGPFSLAAGGGNLIAYTLADHFAFKLGERKQHIQYQPSHRRGRIELLRDADERNVMFFKHLHHPGEIQKRSAEPSDLVDQHAVDLASLNIGSRRRTAGRSMLPPVKPPSS